MSKYTIYGKDYNRKINDTISLCNFFIKKLNNSYKKEKTLTKNQNFIPDFLFVWCFSILEWYFKLTKDAILSEHERYLPSYHISTKYKNIYWVKENLESWSEIVCKVQKLLTVNDKLTTYPYYSVIKSKYDQRNWIIHRGISWKTYWDVLSLAIEIREFIKFCDIEIKKLFKFL